VESKENKISVDVLDYLGKHEDGIISLISLGYLDSFYEATFFYTNDLIALTPDDKLEDLLGCKIEDWVGYQELVFDILKRVVPFDQMINMVPVPNNGLRTSNPHLYRSLVRDSIVTAVKKLDRKARINLRRQLKAKNTLRYSARHGYTGTLLSQQNGALTQFSLNGGYAYHLPISHQLMLSTGLGVTLINSRFDSNKAMVADPTNDPLYQQYATGGMNDYAVYINPGINVYNDKFYASYSISKIASQSVGDNSFISTQNIETVHHLAMGTFLNINQHVSIHPAFLLSIKESSPYSTLFSTKVFYEEQLWLGLHYSLQDAAAASFGLFLLRINTNSLILLNFPG